MVVLTQKGQCDVGNPAQSLDGGQHTSARVRKQLAERGGAIPTCLENLPDRLWCLTAELRNQAGPGDNGGNRGRSEPSKKLKAGLGEDVSVLPRGRQGSGNALEETLPAGQLRAVRLRWR